MTGLLFGSKASRKPRFESTNERSPLHCRSDTPLVPSDSHVDPPSVVCQMSMTSVLHCVSGEPPGLSQPSWSLTNEISGLGKPPAKFGGSGLCCQVAPRSVERYRYCSVIKAHTT